jgi:TolA-binding protein
MYNTILERQANDAREDINAIVKELIIEVNESEEAFEKLEGKIDELEDIIILLKAQVQELENKLDNSF